METAPSFYVAFFAGLLSFISPCCLPLYPSYLSYITGVSYDEMYAESNRKQIRRKALTHALFFVLGFSIIFVALGMSASVIGQWFLSYKTQVRQIGGIIIIVMGLFLAGILRLDLLYKQKKWTPKLKPAGYLGSLLVGISFSAGWTPCVGPILASVLIFSATNQASGMALMFFYTLGFAIPFLILAYTLGSVRWLLKYSDRISKIGGWIMVIMGFLLITNWMTKITSSLIKVFGGFIGF